MNALLRSRRFRLIVTALVVQRFEFVCVASMSWSFLGTSSGNTRRRASSSSVSQAEAISGGKEFNEQVMLRVVERLNEYMTAPIEACERLLEFRSMNAFQYGMTAPDYKLIFQYLYMELQEKSLQYKTSTDRRFEDASLSKATTVLYFALEDGTVFYFYDNLIRALYREPGNDGYIVGEKDTSSSGTIPMVITNTTDNAIFTSEDPYYKHYISCIDSTTGIPANCTMSPGKSYIQCVNDCELIPCLYSDSNQNNNGSTNSAIDSKSKNETFAQSLCPNYVVMQVSEDERVVRGYVPSTDFCINIHGQPEQRPGFVLVSVTGENDGTNETNNDDENGDVETSFHQRQPWMKKEKQVLGNCYYSDQQTLVNRSDVIGAYARCGQTTVISNTDNNSSNTLTEDDTGTIDAIGNDTFNSVCNDVFNGGLSSYEYDGRYREWYMLAKRYQRPIWTLPYKFFSFNQLGITYARPIYNRMSRNFSNSEYSTDNHKNDDSQSLLFVGVVAVDYRLEQINAFLTKYYGNTDMLVLIVERVEPFYLIASSRYDAQVTKLVQFDPHNGSETSVPCPSDAESKSIECVPVRISINELQFSSNTMDVVSYRSFAAHKEQNFPEAYYRIPVKESDTIGSSAYVAQGKLYNLLPFVVEEAKSSSSSSSGDQDDNSNNWHVFVIVPMDRSALDAAMPGTAAFAIVIALGTFGFVGCTIVLIILYQKRKQKAMVNSDWRFTCAFIAGCAVLNLSTFTLLGENTDPMCMLRMWSFNGLFACALSPLFVKVWRMAALLAASQKFQRKVMSNCQAIMLTLPLILIQLLILAIFSIIDPPQQTELLGVGGDIMDTSGTISMEDDATSMGVASDGLSPAGGGGSSVGYQQVTCASKSNAFFITQLVYDALLLSIGCILAYKTRDLDPRFGEAKQLGFSMYNVAFTGITIVATIKLTELDHVSQIILQAVGVFWASFFCSFAFVLPRLLEVQKDRDSNIRNQRSNGSDLYRFSSSGVHQEGIPSGLVYHQNQVSTTSKGSNNDTKTTGKSIVTPLLIWNEGERIAPVRRYTS